ncbi:MAG: sulfatase-like hydrolase/transferase [Gemmatales bacterium]|nr:sulfatase-like hydrolase/transferase [Gemmatales bacterium]MDW8175907.1 sulfatase-like hydrolase/transferase [Gemmatales bacterium]
MYSVSRTWWARWLLGAWSVLLFGKLTGAEAAQHRPCILWLTCEDMGPHLGCFGDPLAMTPNLDRLAREGVRFTNVFTVTGVCAPSRSCLITGVYPASLGTHHMRCQATLPEGVTGFPAYLRRAGYYCSNNVKEDYNFRTPHGVWDESSSAAHWRKRPPDKPFFSVFNITVTHESQIRLPEASFQRLLQPLGGPKIDPAKIVVPTYHADTPVVRRDWARYYELIRVLDHQVGERLQQLEQDGLADNTIVFFFSDHGPGLWRCKRWIYDSSVRVPLIIRFPKRWSHLAPAGPGEVCDRLISFVDLAPTVLSLCDVPLPPTIQGQAFLGKQGAPPRRFVYGARDRMDERYDLVRGVRDRRFHYLRNFHVTRPYAQFIEYMELMPSMQEMRRLAASGKLPPWPAQFFAPRKPGEELYDTLADPDEVHNLALDPRYRGELERLRQEMKRWMLEIGDLGLLPEAEIHLRLGSRPPWDYAHTTEYRQLLPRLYEAATTPDLERLLTLAQDNDAAVRYWAALRVGERSNDEPRCQALLARLATDAAPVTRLAAAEALALRGDLSGAAKILVPLLQHENAWLRLHAAYVADSFPMLRERLGAQLRQLAKDPNEQIARIARRSLSPPE